MNSNLNQFDQAELIRLVGFLQQTLQKKNRSTPQDKAAVEQRQDPVSTHEDDC
jgi:hypothetical protein